MYINLHRNGHMHWNFYRFDDLAIQEGECAPAGTFIPTPASAPTCAGIYAQCHGTKPEQRLPCCSFRSKCMQKSEFYGKCVPLEDEAPSGWLGTILNYGAQPP